MMMSFYLLKNPESYFTGIIFRASKRALWLERQYFPSFLGLLFLLN